MNTTELSRSQLDFLKCDYMYEVHDETVMDASDLVTDEQIHEHYAGIDFVPGDFGSDYGSDFMERTDLGEEIYFGYGDETYSIVSGEFENGELAVVFDLDGVRVTINLHETLLPEARDVANELYRKHCNEIHVTPASDTER